MRRLVEDSGAATPPGVGSGGEDGNSIDGEVTRESIRGGASGRFERTGAALMIGVEFVTGALVVTPRGVARSVAMGAAVLFQAG